ncbi:MAG: sialidase family protein [Pirellulaceae bacterium]
MRFPIRNNLPIADGKETRQESRPQNVTIKLSDDEGKTWSASRTLEPGFSGYSDLAALPDGKAPSASTNAAAPTARITIAQGG